MINNLIQPPKSKNATTVKLKADQDRSSSAQNCARLFVNSMGEAQRERFKAMLLIGTKCGESAAQAYGVPVDDFIVEVQKVI